MPIENVGLPIAYSNEQSWLLWMGVVHSHFSDWS
jgi:hypothetical protein